MRIHSRTDVHSRDPISKKKNPRAAFMADETEVETVIRLHAVDVRDLFPDISLEDPGSRVCLLCTTKLKDKTHNLTRHLERHHVGALLQMMEQRSSALPSSSTTSARTATPTRMKKLQQQHPPSPIAAATSSPHQQQNKRQKQRAAPTVAPSHGNPHESNGDDGGDVVAVTTTTTTTTMMDTRQIEHAKRALVSWLTSERLPIRLVENRGFRQFLEALNTNFTPPQRDELQRLLEAMHTEQDHMEKENRSHGGEEEDDGDEEACACRKTKRRAARKVAIETLALVAVCRTPEDAPVVLYQQLPCGLLRKGFAKVRIHRAIASLLDALVCRGRVSGRQGVLGRSFVGVVEQLHEETTGDAAIKEQDRVVVGSPYLACDACSMDAEPRSRCTHMTYLGVSSPQGALTEYSVLPIANLHVIPSAIPDDLALLVDDHAVVLRLVSVIKARGMRSIAMITDGMAGCTTGLLVRCLHQALGFSQADTHIFTIASMDQQQQQQQQQLQHHATLTPLDIYDPSALDAVLSQRLAFDGFVDFCGTEASAAFAISAVQPMGTLLFVHHDRFEAVQKDSSSKTGIEIDMNAVVVNELEVVSVGDCSAHVSDAVAYLEEQSADDETREQLRTFLSSPVALGDALGELRSAALDTFQAQYLQVVSCSDRDAGNGKYSS